MVTPAAPASCCVQGVLRGHPAAQVALSEPGLPDPMNPAEVLAPAARDPFHAALLIVLPDKLPPQSCSIDAPETFTAHPLIAELPAVTRTSAW